MIWKFYGNLILSMKEIWNFAATNFHEFIQNQRNIHQIKHNLDPGEKITLEWI